MPPLRVRLRVPSIRSIPSLSTPPLRPAFHLRHTTNTHTRAITTTIAYTPTCPPDTCQCGPVPVPELDIDRETPLLHTMAHYAQHVVVCSEKADWTSRIEDEEGTSGDFVRGLKKVIGRGGQRFDPFNNILTSLSSLSPPSPSDNLADPTTTVLLFPAFVRLSIPPTPETLTSLSSAYLSAPTLHPAHESAGLTPAQKLNLLRNPAHMSELPPPEQIKTPTILICGHGGRDKRCGILGPILVQWFKAVMKEKGVQGNVGTISHVGGHKFAGNVIVYLPPAEDKSTEEKAKNITGEINEEGGAGQMLDLKGSGLWYGRVGPEHVAGIVEETIIGRKIAADLFRGGISQTGDNLAHVLEEQLKRDGIGKGEEEGLKLKPKSRTRKVASSSV